MKNTALALVACGLSSSLRHLL